MFTKNSYYLLVLIIAVILSGSNFLPESKPAARKLSDKEVAALRSDIKYELAKVYTAQTAFKLDHQRYTTDLILLGWSANKKRINYKLGFIEASGPSEIKSEDPNRMDTDEFVSFSEEDDGTIRYEHSIEDVDLSKYQAFCKKKCTADENGFEAILVLHLEGHVSEDVWLINENKEIFHVLDGVTGLQF